MTDSAKWAYYAPGQHRRAGRLRLDRRSASSSAVAGASCATIALWGDGVTEVAGRALVLDEPLSLWGGMDPATGEVIDAHHPQRGAPGRAGSW